MSGMSGGSMLRARRKDINIKPNRKLDRKSSRGMIYENEELRLRTININAEVERGQSDIKKLKRENEQLRREVGALRGEYDRLERLLKARHSEELSDAEQGSNSCCSECESECCTQNNTNDFKDDESPCCKPDCALENQLETTMIKNMGSRSEGMHNVLTNGLGSCGILPAVPEEPLLRVPSNDNKVENHYSTPIFSNQICNSSRTPPQFDNNQEYYTAIVTVPLNSHLADHGVVDLTAPSVFPKAGLDILMNNNPHESFQGQKSPPQIGFIIPPNFNLNECGENSIHNDHNTMIENQSIMNLNRGIQRSNNDNMKKINDYVPFVDPMCRNNDIECVKDSYFVCNTRKIIQQLTVHNPNINNAAVSLNMGIGSNNNEILQSPESNLDVNADDETNKLFKTEKSIELNNDYGDNFPGNYKEEQAEDFVKKDFETPLTTQLTTEINSTVLMFERKKVNNQKPNKMQSFFRSQSAPVETLSNEPVYATIKKIPHKTTHHSHIRNLENEVKYIPETDLNKEKNQLTKSNKINLNMPSILKNSEGDSPTCEMKSGENISNFSPKVDSLSETEKHDEPNVIPKSPLVRKKKRFSIHFKRKAKNKNNPPVVLEDSETPTESKRNTDEIKQSDLRNSSERLLELSSSLDSPDLENTVRFKDAEHPCKKHLKHNSTHIPFRNKCGPNGECRRTHRCEKCLMNRKNLSKDMDPSKKRYSPVRSYLKHDSYQEMTTSHSERERTNSLSSSGHSGFSVNTKTRKMSVTPREGSIPWCGCWGNSCL